MYLLLFINFLQLFHPRKCVFSIFFISINSISLHVVNDNNLLTFYYLCKLFDWEIGFNWSFLDWKWFVILWRRLTLRSGDDDNKNCDTVWVPGDPVPVTPALIILFAVIYCPVNQCVCVCACICWVLSCKSTWPNPAYNKNSVKLLLVGMRNMVCDNWDNSTIYLFILLLLF